MEDIELVYNNVTIADKLEDLCYKIGFLESNIQSMGSALEALYSIEDNGSSFYEDNIPRIIYELEDRQSMCQDKLGKLYIDHSSYLKQIAMLNQMINLRPVILGRPDLSLIDEDDLDF